MPESDVVGLAAPLSRAGAAWAERLERAETVLRQWPVAGVLLLALMVILGAAMVSGAP